jgi:hypothetical protein
VTLSLPELRGRIAAARAQDAPVLLLPDEAEAVADALDALEKVGRLCDEYAGDEHGLALVTLGLIGKVIYAAEEAS